MSALCAATESGVVCVRDAGHDDGNGHQGFDDDMWAVWWTDTRPVTRFPLTDGEQATQPEAAS